MNECIELKLLKHYAGWAKKLKITKTNITFYDRSILLLDFENI